MNQADPPTPDDLLRLYRAARYDVRLPGGRRVRVVLGSPCDALPIAAGEPFGFITAWNPFSTPRPAPDNRRAQRELLVRLRDASRLVLPGAGWLPGAWREPSLFAIGIEPGPLDALARAFDQNAIIAGVGAGPARLRLYRADWRGRVSGNDFDQA